MRPVIECPTGKHLSNQNKIIQISFCSIWVDLYDFSAIADPICSTQRVGSAFPEAWVLKQVQDDGMRGRFCLSLIC